MFDLYILEHCPYCKKVRKFFEENGVAFRTFDIEDYANLDKLLTSGGTRQVPFLIDKENNVKMYESDDIIEYAKRFIK